MIDEWGVSTDCEAMSTLEAETVQRFRSPVRPCVCCGFDGEIHGGPATEVTSCPRCGDPGLQVRELIVRVVGKDVPARLPRAA